VTIFEIWLFYPGERASITIQRENWVSSATNSGKVENKKVPPSAENLNPNMQHIARNFMDEEYRKLYN
jgi:hypothetical protein